MTFEEMGEAWYALTLEGTWGTSPGSHLDDRILLGQNAVFLHPKTNLMILQQPTIRVQLSVLIYPSSCFV